LSEEKRTVIIGRRKITAVPREDSDNSAARGSERVTPARERPGAVYPAEPSSSSDDNEMSVEIKDRVFRARDDVFQGKGIRKPSVPQVRDSTLLHTELRPKKRVSDRDNADNEDTREGQAGKDNIPIKKRTNTE
jgi:hypothetical protein